MSEILALIIIISIVIAHLILAYYEHKRVKLRKKVKARAKLIDSFKRKYETDNDENIQ